MTAFQTEIVVYGPGHDGTRLGLNEGITSLGRLPSNDVILVGDLVSRHHSRILFFDGKASIQDLGSHNGTWVNGSRVATLVVGSGDQIRIGNFRLSLARPNETPTPPISEALPDSVRTRPPSSVRFDVAELKTGGETSEAMRWRLLFSVSRLSSEANDLPNYLQRITALVEQFLKASCVGLYRAAAGADRPEQLAFRSSGAFEPAVPASVLNWTIAKNFTVFSKDLSQDIRFGDETTEESKRPIAIVSAPLADEQRSFGALFVARPPDAPFGENEIDDVEAIAQLVASGISQVERRCRGEASLALDRSCPTPVVEQLLSGGVPIGLQPCVGTVCAVELDGVDVVATTAPAAAVTELVEAFLGAGAETIKAHGGTVIWGADLKLLGVFGAPLSMPNDSGAALKTARALQENFGAQVAAHPDWGVLALRIGVESGPLLLGLSVVPKRVEVVALGEAVQSAVDLAQTANSGIIKTGPRVEHRLEEHTRDIDADATPLPGPRD